MSLGSNDAEHTEEPDSNDAERTTYLPISDYGVIGNDDRCALVGRDGSIDWCCFPHVESPSVFAAILDTDTGGRFAVRPSDTFESRQEYIDRTNVLETTFETDDGVATVTDFMPRRVDGPVDNEIQQSVIRKIEGDRGTVSFDIEYEPRFDYARADTELEADDSSTVTATGDGDQDRLYLHSDVEFDIDPETDCASSTISIDRDKTCWFHLQYGDDQASSKLEYGTLLEETTEYWQQWLGNCEESASEFFAFEEEWQEILVRSALTLKLCFHEDTGSICAAPTTSLPEQRGGSLNWDYRYNWIRDAKFTVQAFYNVGQSAEAHQYFEWFREIGHEDPKDIQPLYGLHSERDIGEETLDHLSGYRGSTPVRIGNEAAKQDQYDIYGTIIQGIYETILYDEGLTDEDWDSITALADYTCEIWDEPDASIWEYRTARKHFVHSKLLCWVALDRAIELARSYDRDAPLDRWNQTRERIRDAIIERGYNEELGSFVQYFDAEEALDATALLIPLYDFLPAEDPRVRGTIETIRSELTTDDGLVYRFKNTGFREDDVGGFFLCSFWLVDALVMAGETEDAREVFENVLEYTTDLGLLSEMVDPESGRLLGNFPQAFSHIGLLNSVLYLASALEDVDGVEPEDLTSGATKPLFRRHGESENSAN